MKETVVQRISVRDLGVREEGWLWGVRLPLSYLRSDWFCLSGAIFMFRAGRHSFILLSYVVTLHTQLSICLTIRLLSGPREFFLQSTQWECVLYCFVLYCTVLYRLQTAGLLQPIKREVCKLLTAPAVTWGLGWAGLLNRLSWVISYHGEVCVCLHTRQVRVCHQTRQRSVSVLFLMNGQDCSWSNRTNNLVKYIEYRNEIEYMGRHSGCLNNEKFCSSPDCGVGSETRLQGSDKRRTMAICEGYQ